MNLDKNYIYLYSTNDKLILNLIRLRFEEESYDFRILNEQISGIYPIPGIEARVFIHDDHYSEGKLLLQKILNSLKEQTRDSDFSDLDLDDIEYEKQVSQREKEMEEANWKNVLPLLIILLIVIITLIFAL